MNNRLGLVLLLFVLFAVGCAVTAVAFRPTVDITAQALVNHATQPDPLGDVLAVREEAAQSGKGWATVGMVLAGLVVVGFVFGYLHLKAKKTREDRLLLNAQRHRPAQRPFTPLPQQDVRDLPPVRRPSLVSHVPEWEDGTYE